MTTALAAIDTNGTVLAIRRTPRTYTHAIYAPVSYWAPAGEPRRTANIVATWCGRLDLAVKALAQYPGGRIVTVREVTAEEASADRKSRAKPKRTIRAVLDGVVIHSLTTQRARVTHAGIAVYADLGAGDLALAKTLVEGWDARTREDAAKHGWEPRLTAWTPETLVADRRENFLRTSEGWRYPIRLNSGEVAVVNYGDGSTAGFCYGDDALPLAGFRLLRTTKSS